MSTNSWVTLLIDTGAEISLLKCRNNNLNDLNPKNTTNISGIGQGTIQSLGTLHLEMCIANAAIPYEFHIVPDNFPIPGDGIIGLDFIKKYNCILEFHDQEDWFTLRPKNFRNINIPIIHSLDNEIILPARSEVIRKIQLTSTDTHVLIPNQELQPGIIIASALVNTQNVLIRIINTTEKDAIVSSANIKSESLDDYDVYNANIENSAQRTSEVLKLLKFPSLFKSDLTKLCTEYSDIFGLETETISANNFYKQKLRLNDKTPVYIKNYRMPESQKPEIQRQVDKLIKDGIVEPSISEYNSPLLLVPKKSLPNSEEKRWRLVVDYRQINKKLLADKFPLPRIEDILDQLGRAKYFSCLDLMSGFHQIELDERSRNITSFSTSTGAYRYTRLPFGLKIAPNSFQRMMTLAFSGLTPSQAFLYMDDLVVIGCSEKHMLKNLTDVFKLCRQHNLKLHPEKCTFFMKEVTYLGHKCTDKGILPDDSKYEVIKNYPKPVNADEARRFVAFCNYYRRFIKNFSEKSRHLTRLCKKNVPFEWTSECNDAFEYLKRELMKPTLLQYPDFSKQFCITTDASKQACGAVLSQDHNGQQLPVAYASRSFTKGESNKSTTEQELAAIHWAINHFRPYVYGRHFLVQSDHRPLSYLFSMRNPSSKLTRMRLDLEEFEFTVEYLKGKDNHVADALSRITIGELKAINRQILKVTTRSTTRQKNTCAGEKLHEPNEKENIKMPNIYQVINNIDAKKYVILKIDKHKCLLKRGKQIITRFDMTNFYSNEIIDLDQFFQRLNEEARINSIIQTQLSPSEQIFEFVTIKNFKEKGNKILKNLKIALLNKVTKIDKNDKVQIKAILSKYHDDPSEGGHSGISRTLRKIKNYYYWPQMTKAISKYVKTCLKCQQAKTTKHTKTPLTITETPATAFDKVLIDTIGPLPRSENGNEYAVTIICDLTKYLVTVPIPNKSAKSVAKAIFENFILKYGPMKTIITDMGTEYKNQIIDDLCKYMKIKNITSTAHHHQTLGTIERSHRTFNEYVRSYISVDKTDWDIWIQYFTYCFNTTPSVVHEYCPYELVFGRLPRQFIDFNRIDRIDPIYNMDDYSKEVKLRLEIAYRRAKNMLDKAKADRKIKYDRNISNFELKIGDKILLKNETGHKLDNNYLGPYLVSEIGDNDNITIIGNKNKKQIVHKDRLKIFNS